MGKTVLIAGAGPAGLATAALLAKGGMDVTVYETQTEDALGSAFWDTFSMTALKIAGVKLPPDAQYTVSDGSTLFSPNQEHILYIRGQRDQPDIQMERRELQRILLRHAETCGVKFCFSCEILSPILLGNRVVGLKTSLGDFYGDLIVDAAGLCSPLRSKLPAVCGIENQLEKGQILYFYRAVFEKQGVDAPESFYNIYLMPNWQAGFGRVTAHANTVDVTLGSLSPLPEETVEQTLEFFRSRIPCLGTKLLYGGSMLEAPARHPLSLMVSDGYAAVGDSAFMTLPIIGTGIANSLKAARILANVVLTDKLCAFSAETLWEYQVVFYKKLGSALASFSFIAQQMDALTPDELDAVFEQEILTADDLSAGADNTNLINILRYSPTTLRSRLERICHDRALLRKLVPLALQISKASAMNSLLPKRWNRQSVLAWAKRYLNSMQLRNG